MHGAYNSRNEHANKTQQGAMKTMAGKNETTSIDPSVFAANPKGDGAGAGEAAGGYVIDFASVPNVNEPIPPGTYNCTIVAAEPTTSKAGGNPMIKLRWRIDDEGDYHHRNIFDHLVFSPNALWRVRQVLEAIGYASNFAGAINPENLLGESATLKITVQAGNGINPETGEPYPPRNNVARVLPIGTSSKVADLL